MADWRDTMKKIVFLGSGAIGRGFLPILFKNKYEFLFVDINQELIDSLNREKEYTAYRAKDGKLEKKMVPVKRAYHIAEFSLSNFNDIVAVFMSVGPRNCLAAAECLKGVLCPVILCENDPGTVIIVKNFLKYDKVFFGIPDVITSNTASPVHLKEDPLSIHTEDGVLFVDERSRTEEFSGDIIFCNEDELKKQWSAKFYLHNTTHCIAAYLGALVGLQYLHEAMKFPEIRKIVTGAMDEMLMSLKLKWEIPHSFLDWYAEKELRRFSNELLYDPISRVAREPLRKLELKGRLIGAAQICLSLGFIPHNIIIGIVSALLFENQQDADNYISFIRKNLSSKVLMTYILGLRDGEVMEMVMEEQFPKMSLKLELLVKNTNKEILCQKNGF